MRGFLFLALAISVPAHADGLSGKTADGCSYKIINGQYLTSCPGKGASEPTPVAQDTVIVNSGRPVGSYGDVPMRRNSAAAAPSMQQPRIMEARPASAPVSSITSSIEAEGQGGSAIEDERRERLKNKLLDKTYVGAILGASNMKSSNSGSAVGMGLNLGTNIDDHFGVELGWSYAKQNLRLGLASRGGNVDQSANPSSSNDAALTSHLFTGELQAHLTDPLKRLRPYLGAGIGWRTAKLSETPQAPVNSDVPNYGATGGGSLHQSAFGGLVSAGSKLRLSKSFNLGFAFRYFFPLLRQSAKIEQPSSPSYPGDNGENQNGETKLSKGDDALTGSSQYQVVGGLQYAF